ncbi:hypothetical protein FACS1894152_8060 [Bacilli bacterium]|nr:hypothetical protein FACS1894152_8060 [Bacilli bacterium]
MDMILLRLQLVKMMDYHRIVEGREHMEDFGDDMERVVGDMEKTVEDMERVVGDMEKTVEDMENLNMMVVLMSIVVLMLS